MVIAALKEMPRNANQLASDLELDGADPSRMRTLENRYLLRGAHYPS
jgi:hypothetical protein